MTTEPKTLRYQVAHPSIKVRADLLECEVFEIEKDIFYPDDDGSDWTFSHTARILVAAYDKESAEEFIDLYTYDTDAEYYSKLPIKTV